MKIYAVKISEIEDQELNTLCSYISLDKKSRIEKFIYKKDKIRALIGEILLKVIINQEIGLKVEDIAFDKNSYGKPHLVNCDKFHFNISHSGEFVVCAVDDKPIGIDVEEERDIKFEEIADSFFTEKELHYIMKEDSEPSLSKFYRIWTLKESYIKCCGKGLSIPLKSFSIDINNDEPIKVISEQESSECVFKSYDIEPGYKMSVCSFNRSIPSIISIIDQNSLIGQFTKLIRVE